MRKTFATIATLALLSQSISAQAEELKSKDFKRFYIGGFGGYSKTIDNHFKDKKTNTTFYIKDPSVTYGGLLGYKITEDVMVELSFEQKVKYPVVIQLDKKYGGEKAKSWASADVYMINFVYNLNDFSGIQPFVKIGAGIEQIKLKQTQIMFDLPNGMNVAKLKTARHTSNSLAMEFGIGASKKITDDFSLNVSANLHVAKNAKMKVYTFNQDKTTANFLDAYNASRLPTASDVAYDQKTVKQTFGVGEITVGFTYDLPI
ncbi:MAG: outer membrane beta-barrel protein [Rickettsiaceae bacterium]|nr:outer membrane beta-barrel protein [Rickettsiaceae bacterium]